MTTQKKSIGQKLLHEFKSVAIATIYFLIWFGILIFLKKLILSEYHVEFTNLSMAVVGALILGKVVLVIDHIPLAPWTKKRPAIYFIIFRTLMNTVAVFILLVIEKSFEVRHETGGFGSAIVHVLEHRDNSHMWASTLVVSMSLFWFNVFFVLVQYVGLEKLISLFFRIPVSELKSKNTE